MSKAYRAADDIKKLSKYLQGLIEFGAELESVASLEQNKLELEAAVNLMKSQKDKAQVELSSVSEKLSLAQHGLELAEQKAEHVIADAHKKATELHLELKGQAQVHAEKLIEDAKAKVKAFTHQLADLHGERASVEQELASLKAQLQNAKAEMAAFKASLGV